MSRQRFETCQYCHTVKWPVRGLGRVCPRCDALPAWPSIMANYRPGPWQIEHPDPIADLMRRHGITEREAIARHNASHPSVPRVSTPDTELQRDVDEILRDSPYDWETEGDTL